MKDYLEKVLNKEDLTGDEPYKAMQYIMEGRANDCQVASFLTALKMKGETSEEISGFSKAMLDKAVKVKSSHPDLVDTCGTGGDGLSTFNISTTAAFIAAGAGAVVAKHGNRGVSSRSGSADVLEELGVKIDLECSDVSKCIDEVGIGFIFAPRAHAAMAHVAKARKDMGIRTVFNILGPLTNPAAANGRVLGVFDKGLIEIMAVALRDLGVERAFVVSGDGGMDELSVSGNSNIAELKNGEISKYVLDPGELGLKRSDISQLAGGEPKYNAGILTGILSGKEKGPKKDSAVLNAAAAIVAGKRSDSIKDALGAAAASVESGKAMEKLEQLIEYTSRFV
jgi:anthranilate phosphoribosyltransferase